MFYDYHVHSSFSPDSVTPMQSTILEGIKRGVKEICFTDHTDFDYEVPDLLFEFDSRDYFKTIDKLKQEFGDKINIKTGVEIGIQPHIIDRCNEFVDTNKFDFVISSLHMCNKQDLYNGDFYMNRTSDSSYKAYLEEMLLCAKNFEKSNVLGHINLIKRYNKDVRLINTLEYKDVLEAIFKTLIESNRGIEINTSSLRQSDTLFLTKEILEFYHELGGKIITTGSDSHTPDTLAFGFNIVYEMMKDIGFKYVASFDKMQPIFNKI